MTYDEAVSQLHRAPFNEFVGERKRLAGELKAQGEKDAAARLAKLARPPVSAWAVNQLWWQQRELFDGLIEAAERVKAGDREASKQHRQLLAELREAAAEILKSGGNAATETTLRRVTTTLAALAATGGFDPEPAGALSADRDPPGFETFAGVAGAPEPPAAKREEHTDAAARRRAEAEQKRAEETERERRRAERERLSAALRDAKELHGARQREVTRLRGELEAAEQGVREAAALLAEIEEKLAAL